MTTVTATDIAQNRQRDIRDGDMNTYLIVLEISCQSLFTIGVMAVMLLAYHINAFSPRRAVHNGEMRQTIVNAVIK
jgi:hypothetical protein